MRGPTIAYRWEDGITRLAIACMGCGARLDAPVLRVLEDGSQLTCEACGFVHGLHAAGLRDHLLADELREADGE